MADLGRNHSVIQQREPDSRNLHPLRSPTLGSMPTAYLAAGGPLPTEYLSAIGNAVETVSHEARNPALGVLRTAVLYLGILSCPLVFLEIRLVPGITVNGEIGAVCRIEFQESVGGPWQLLRMVALSKPTEEFFDYSVGGRSRFYRAIAPE